MIWRLAEKHGTVVQMLQLYNQPNKFLHLFDTEVKGLEKEVEGLKQMVEEMMEKVT